MDFNTENTELYLDVIPVVDNSQQDLIVQSTDISVDIAIENLTIPIDSIIENTELQIDLVFDSINSQIDAIIDGVDLSIDLNTEITEFEVALHVGDKGDTGNVGPQGPIGPQGDIGPEGQRGEQGEKGDKGDVGSQGEKGEKGDIGLTGDMGPSGMAGKDGADGYIPIKGFDYFDGANGSDGAKGDDGPIGPQGEPGPKGDPADPYALIVTENIPVNISGGRYLGKYPSGSTINVGTGMTLEAIIRDIALESINPSAAVSASGTIQYNATTGSITVTMSSTCNNPSPAYIETYVLSYNRGSGDWIQLYSGAPITSFTHNDDTSIASENRMTTLLSNSKTSGFQYKLTVTDSIGSATTVNSNTITPLGYVAPSSSTSNDTKEIGDIGYSSTRNITKNSVNTTLTNWQLFVSIDNGAFSSIGSVSTNFTNPVSIVITTDGKINSYAITGILDATSIRIRLRVIDSVTTTDINYVFTRSLYYPVYATTSSISTLTAQSAYSLNSVISTSMVVEGGGYKQSLELPAAWSNITKLEQFNTLSNAWDIINLTTFTPTTDVVVSVQGINRSYKKYTHNGTLIGARQLKWTV
jgi:hypothetical protein